MPACYGTSSGPLRMAVMAICFLFAILLAVSPIAAATIPNPSDATVLPDPYASLGITLSATSAIAIETERSVELYAKDAEKPVHMPVLSKVMTALLTLERFSSSSLVTISKIAGDANLAVAKEDRIEIETGNKYTVDFLITAMFYMDSDAAAIALAEQVSEEEPAFVRLMNDRAGQLKMTSTHFVNSTGRGFTGTPTSNGGVQEKVYPLSTPRDAILLVNFFLKNKNYTSVVNKAFKTSASLFYSTEENNSWVIDMTHNLSFAWVDVENLTGVFSIVSDGRSSLIATFSAGGFETLVILADGSPEDRIADLKMIASRIYGNYTNTVLVTGGQPAPNTFMDIVDGKVFGLVYKRTVSYVHRIGETAVFNRKYTSAGPHSLPLMAEDTVGTMTFTFNNGSTISVECVPDRTIYSVDSSIIDKALTAFEANGNLTFIIQLSAGLLAVAMLYHVVAVTTRLVWRIRLRRAEKTAGVTRHKASSAPDDGGEHRE